MPSTRVQIKLLAEKIVMIVLCVLLLLPGGQLQARIVDDLYQASVPISDQSSRAQRTATREGMEQVLIKVSGDRNISEHADMRRALNSADQYLKSYRYDIRNTQIYFVAEFDRQKLEGLLRTFEFPVWGSRRPDSLVWMVVEEPDTLEREIIADGSRTEAIQILTAQAKARGILLDFPLLDLVDMQNLSVYDVWGGFTQVITSASERYQPDYIIAARLYRPRPLTGALPDVTEPASDDLELPNWTGDTAEQWTTAPETEENQTMANVQEADTPQVVEADWQLDWQIIRGLSLDAVKTSGSLQGDEAAQLLTQLTHLFADQLAAEYAIQAQQLAQQNSVEITIMNVQNLTDYVAVSQFLVNLSVVDKATLISLEGQKARFQLSLLGHPDDLLTTLRLEDSFRMIKDEFGRDIENQEYFWVP